MMIVMAMKMIIFQRTLFLFSVSKKQIHHKTVYCYFVCFLFYKDAENVLQKEHVLDGVELAVRPHNPIPDDREGAKPVPEREGTQRGIEMESDLITFIQKWHKEELDDILQRLDATIKSRKETSATVISPVDQGRSCDEPWSERKKAILNFLDDFTKKFVDFHLEEDLEKEVQERWCERHIVITKDPVDVAFFVSKHFIRLIGKKACVAEVEKKFEELLKEIKEDDRSKKLVTRHVEEDLPKEKLHLLEVSGLCKRLENERKHLRITIEASNNRLIVEAARVELQVVTTELLRFLAKTKEQVIKLPKRKRAVLISPNGSRFLQQAFQEHSIVAVLVPEQMKSANEVLIVGQTVEHTAKAEELIQSAFQECSLPLKEENIQVMKDDAKWKILVSQMMSTKVVSVEILSNTLWVSGASQDVTKCFQEAQKFLEEYTIYTQVLEVPRGITQLLFKECKDKMERIKKQHSIRCRAAARNEGIEISGNEESLATSSEEIQALVKKVVIGKVNADKPGMAKFFRKPYGKQLLKSLEVRHRCIIEETQPASVDVALSSQENKQTETKCICSYVTPEDKKISVYSADVTKHKADAIVNLTNEQLKHEGRLDIAVVRAGEDEVQYECNAFIQDNGALLDGQVFTSGPGKLPSKCIMHVVRPQWDAEEKMEQRKGKKTMQERVLQEAISNCLEEAAAASYNSIAIPAISPGSNGFPSNLCAKVILETVIQFFKRNRTCTLSEVHLVNSRNATVAKFVEEMRKRFGKAETFYEKQNPLVSSRRRCTRSAPAGREAILAPQHCLVTPEGVKISVKAGDLAKEEVCGMKHSRASIHNASLLLPLYWNNLL